MCSSVQAELRRQEPSAFKKSMFSGKTRESFTGDLTEINITVSGGNFTDYWNISVAVGGSATLSVSLPFLLSHSRVHIDAL